MVRHLSGWDEGSFDQSEVAPAGSPILASELRPGQDVVYRRRRAKVLWIIEADTPSGGTVVLARIIFPRGGQQTVFAGQLEERK